MFLHHVNLETDSDHANMLALNKILIHIEIFLRATRSETKLAHSLKSLSKIVYGNDDVMSYYVLKKIDFFFATKSITEMNQLIYIMAFFSNN